MMVNCSESGHPIFCASSAFERGELQSKGHGKKSIHFNGSEENIEWLLRTIFSANQLSVCRAIADLCKELSEEFRAPGKPEAPDHLETMETPTGPSVAGPHTNEQQQGNLVQYYERRFEQLSDDQKLFKPCSDAGLQIVEIGQYFFTLDTEEGNVMQHLCREYTMPRCDKETRAKGWILKNTRIGPVVDIKVCRHEDRYSIEVLVESLFQYRAASWVRIVSGIDKYVTDSMQTKEEEHGASERLVAKARPQLKPAVTLSSVSIPVRDRKWIDIETQRSHDQKCCQASKAMTRLLRHDRTVPRETDEAVLFDDVLEECRKRKVDGASQWSLNDWISILAKRRRSQQKVSILLESKLFQPLPIPQSNSRTFRR